jgi:hypothetical protein
LDAPLVEIDSRCVDASSRPLRRPAHLVRIAGLYVLAGALLKLFLGTPADLPPALRRIPMGLGDLFKVAIAIEVFVGLVALFRPARGWLPLMLLLGAFVAVLVSQVAEGAASCGCLGPTLDVPPAVMLAIDVAWLVLLFAVRPWRLAPGGTRDWAVVAGVLAVAVALPFLFTREAGAWSLVRANQEELEMKSWVGKRLADTKLARWTDLSHVEDGLWFFYSRSCPVCDTCLFTMPAKEQGEREVTLVHLTTPSTEGGHGLIHELPKGPWIHTIELPSLSYWGTTPPCEVVVEGGKVVSVREGMTFDDCK